MDERSWATLEGEEASSVQSWGREEVASVGGGI